MTTTTNRPPQTDKLTLAAPKAAPPTPKATEPEPKAPKLPPYMKAFRKFAELVPEGQWPAMLPIEPEADRYLPLAAGIYERVSAMLPPEHHRQLYHAIKGYSLATGYLQALAADGAQRWSDDGSATVGPVSRIDRMIAAHLLVARATTEAARS